MKWVVCPKCLVSFLGAVGETCADCGAAVVATPLYDMTPQVLFQLLTSYQTGGLKMKCPDCDAKITAKNYDPEFEWYECPKCEGCWTPDEIVKDELTKHAVPLAKGKKRRTEIQEDESAIEQYEKENYTVKKVSKKESRHRDEVPLGQVLNIIADEIEEIVAEAGGKIDRLNAREFYAMNLWRPLVIHHNVSARDQAVPHKLCKAHRG